MRVLGIIVNYRTPELALEAAKSLARQLASHPGSRVLIIENDSRDGSEARIRSGLQGQAWAAGVTLVPSGRNGGFGAGNNIGMRLGLEDAPKPDVFYLLNPDAMPDDGAVDAIARHLRDNPRTGIVGTGVHGGDGVPRPVAFRFPSILSEVERGARLGLATRLLARWRVPLPLSDEPIDADWVTGSSMVIRREVVEQVGLFDEGYFLYFEELDLCRRARRAGYRVVHLPDATVMHAQGAATGIHDLSRRVPGYWFESRWRYFRKHHGVGYAIAASAAWACSHVLWATSRLVRGRPRDAPPRLLRDFVRHTARAAIRGPTPRP